MRNRAFTLSEILITFGIIGVVAAVTMPTLIQNYKKREIITRLKKYNSIMSQAFLISTIENGSVSEWNITNPKEFFDKYLSPYIKYVKSEEIPEFDNHQKWYKVFFSDGSVSYNYAPINGAECIDFILDTNGDKYPNEIGRDRYRFIYCTNSSLNYGKANSWSSYYLRRDTTLESRFEKCKQNTAFCSGYLEINGWNFGDNYPYKL